MSRKTVASVPDDLDRIKSIRLQACTTGGVSAADSKFMRLYHTQRPKAIRRRQLARSISRRQQPVLAVVPDDSARVKSIRIQAETTGGVSAADSKFMRLYHTQSAKYIRRRQLARSLFRSKKLPVPDDSARPRINSTTYAQSGTRTLPATTGRISSRLRSRTNARRNSTGTALCANNAHSGTNVSISSVPGTVEIVPVDSIPDYAACSQSETRTQRSRSSTPRVNRMTSAADSQPETRTQRSRSTPRINPTTYSQSGTRTLPATAGRISGRLRSRTNARRNSTGTALCSNNANSGTDVFNSPVPGTDKIIPVGSIPDRLRLEVGRSQFTGVLSAALIRAIRASVCNGSLLPSDQSFAVRRHIVSLAK